MLLPFTNLKVFMATTEIAKTPENKMHLFKSHADVMGYVFKSGKGVHFMQGQYATSAKDEIEELTLECENGHPNFYIDPKQVLVSREELDPLYKIREQIRAEERAKLMAATDINRDMGSTDQNAKLTGIANSSTVAGLIVGSEAQGAAAQGLSNQAQSNPNASRPSITIPKK